MSVGVAVVAVVLVGGFATVQLLSPRPTPRPTAVMLPETVPVPTAAPVLEPSPAPAAPELVAQGSPAGWTDDWDLCGLPLGMPEPAARIPFAVTTAGLPASTPVGGTWTGVVSARSPLGAPTELEVVGSVALLDGLVVGVPRTAPTSSLLTATSGAPVDLPVPGDLASCVGAPAGPGGTQAAPPLAAGRYEVVVLLRSTAGGTQTSAVANAGDLTITGSGGAARPTTASAALAPVSFATTMDQTACASSPATDSFAHPTGYPSALVAGSARLVDGALVTSVTALNTGRSLADARIGPVAVQVRRDGKVVGHGQTAALPAAPVGTWASGSSVDVAVEIGPYTCTFMNGEPWPPGAYELYATVASSWGASAGTSAAGGPWVFTLP